MVEKKSGLKKVLFLTPRLPFPLIGGDRIKSYNLLSYLGENYDTTLVTFYQGTDSPDIYKKQLEKLGIRVFIIKLNPVKAVLNSIYFTNPLYPLEIKYYTQPEFAKIVNKLLKEENFDFAFSFFMRTAEYLRNFDIKKVLIAEDCRVLYQNRSFKQSHSLIQKAVRLFEYLTLKRYEPNVVNDFDFTTLVTNHDIKEMTKQNPNGNYRLLTNGTVINPINDIDFDNRSGIVFCGKLDIWACVVSVKKIATEIFPLIKEKVPNAKFKIVGANPPKEVRNLVSDDIILYPNVPDTKVFMKTSSLFLHPHTSGTGIQNKLLEAMACGCPVVTTPIGNQGIEGTHKENILIGNNTEELAKLAIEILTKPELAKKIGANGRELMKNTHSWDIIFSEFESIISELEEM